MSISLTTKRAVLLVGIRSLMFTGLAFIRAAYKMVNSEEEIRQPREKMKMKLDVKMQTPPFLPSLSASTKRWRFVLRWSTILNLVILTIVLHPAIPDQQTCSIGLSVQFLLKATSALLLVSNSSIKLRPPKYYKTPKVNGQCTVTKIHSLWGTSILLTVLLTPTRTPWLTWWLQILTHVWTQLWLIIPVAQCRFTHSKSMSTAPTFRAWKCEMMNAIRCSRRIRTNTRFSWLQECLTHSCIKQPCTTTMYLTLE